MDIRLLAQAPSRLRPDLLPEIQHGVHRGGRDARERQTVRKRKNRREEERGVRFIRVEVHAAGVGVEDPGDVVGGAGVVVRAAAAHGQVGSVPGVGVVEERGQEPFMNQGGA